MTHICISNLTIIGSDNGLASDRRQAIIWTNAGLLLIGPLGTNFSEILIEILTFSFKKMRLKVSSAKRRPFCLGLNVLTPYGLVMPNGDIKLGQHWPWGIVAFAWGQFHRKCSRHLSLMWVWKLLIQGDSSISWGPMSLWVWSSVC